MSLRDDLLAIDFSAVVQARGSITASVRSSDLQALLSGGAAQAALGGLGASLTDLRASMPDPASLLRPVAESLGGLSARLSTDDLPIGQYVSAVGEGVQIALRLVDGLEGDPNRLGSILGGSLGEQLDSVVRFISSQAQVGTPDLANLRGKLDRLDRGLTGSDSEMAELALDVLLPFPQTAPMEIRSALDQILSGAGAIALPEGRFNGLAAALDAVNAAALAGDAAALQAALGHLGQVRDNTIAVVEEDLRLVLEAIGRIRLDAALPPMVRATDALRVAQVGVLELLQSLRRQLAFLRTQLDEADPADMGAFFERMVDLLESEAQQRIVAPIDAAVVQLEEFVRGLLRQLPLRSIRTEISRFLAEIAEAIRGLGIEAAIQTVRNTFGEIRDLVSSDALVGSVQAALDQARQTITNALGGITDALGKIGGRINAVAGDAEAVLQRAADMLSGFATAIESTRAAIDQLGIEEAADQVIDTLATLREKAEAVLSVAPLPEPMRPVVEQLIATLEGVDFEVVFKPLRDAASQLDVPDEVRTTITDTLAEIRAAIDNLIPAELIASIEAEVNEALDVIRGFDPASLLPDVTGFLNDAATFIEQLDPRQAVSSLSGPFQTILDGIDAVHPRRLLAPAIEAYDSVFARLQLPGPDIAMQRFTDLINSGGEAMAQAVTAPARQLASPAPSTGGTPAGGPGPGGGEAGPGPGPGGGAAPDSFRPGDVVRLFGYLPAKVREGLQALEAGPAGDVLRRIDSLTAGLAVDLRRLQHELRQIDPRVRATLDQALAVIAQRQLTAQANIRVRFADDGGVNVEAAVSAVALAGPGSVLQALSRSLELVAERVAGAVHSAGGQNAAALERAAAALESLWLARATGSLDDFLALLDPEPLANDLDELVGAALRKAPELIGGFQDQLAASIQRISGLVQQLNPGAQAQKFTRVLNVLKEELDVLNPGRLADELGEIHGAIRRIVASFDPAAIANDLFAVLQEAADTIRELDPATLLGDLSVLDDVLAQAEAAIPTRTLSGVGESLSEIGARLVELDPAGLLDAVENLGPRLIEQLEEAVVRIREEIVRLLESIRYTSASASASVSVGVG